MVAKTFKVTLFRDDGVCFIPIPFDPKPIFGKVRVAVRVTLNGYTYRSTIAAMGFAFPFARVIGRRRR